MPSLNPNSFRKPQFYRTRGTALHPEPQIAETPSPGKRRGGPVQQDDLRRSDRASSFAGPP